MIPVIDKDMCTGCGNCVEVCPPLALSLMDEEVALEEEFCEECGFCAVECPTQAIKIIFPGSLEEPSEL
jgi:electron transport complex protein RnfB